MSEKDFRSLKLFIDSFSRNKLVIVKSNELDVIPVNIGETLSKSLQDINKSEKISLKVTNFLDTILQNAISSHPIYGKNIALSNLGILLEPELKVDFFKILDKYSQNNTLFLIWEGEVDSTYLYFLTKENGIKINIKNLSHIVI